MKIAGIDYSITSPAVCVYDIEKNFTFENCMFYFVYDRVKHAKIAMKHFDNFVPFEKNDGWINYQNNQERWKTIKNWTMDILISQDVQKVFLEGYAMGAKGQVFNIAENGGLLKHYIQENGIELQIIEPTTLKKFATGKGNCKKDKMNEAFAEETEHDLHSIFELSASNWNPTSDIIDAYYLCKYGKLNNE